MQILIVIFNYVHNRHSGHYYYHLVSVQFLSEDQQFIQKCDSLYDDNEIEELYNLLLPRSGTGNDEILWRLARAACEYGKQLGGESKKEHIYEAYRYIKLALDINEKNFAVHKVSCLLVRDCF